MKKTALLLAAFAGAVSLNAQDTTSSYSVTTDFTFSSEYIFRGTEQSGNAFQPSVEVTVDDLYFGLWTNQPITKNENNEIDLYGGYNFKVSEELSLEAVGTYYWYPEARAYDEKNNFIGQTKDSLEAGLGLNYTVLGAKTGFYGYYDFVLKATTWQGSIGYSLPLEAIGASFDLNIYGGYVDADDFFPDSGSEVVESYRYYGVDLSIPYKLSDTATATVGVHYAGNENLVGFGGPAGVWSDDNIWFTAGLSVGF